MVAFFAIQDGVQDGRHIMKCHQMLKVCYRRRKPDKSHIISSILVSKMINLKCWWKNILLRIFETWKIQYGRQNGSTISKNAPTIFQHHKKYFSFEKFTSFILFSLGKWLKLILIIEKCFSKMWLLRIPRWRPCYGAIFLFIFFKLWKLTTLYNFTISFCKFSI